MYKPDVANNYALLLDTPQQHDPKWVSTLTGDMTTRKADPPPASPEVLTISASGVNHQNRACGQTRGPHFEPLSKNQ